MKITPSQRVFCSFAFTGEDPVSVEARMKEVVAAFSKLGITVYCNLDDERVKSFTTADQYILAARQEIAKSDVLFVILASERRSEGQLMEVGMALERQMPIVLAQHASTVDKTYLTTLAAASFVWDNVPALVAGIATLK